MTCSDWFLLSWKSVIFSLAIAVKSIFTAPLKLAWKISVCPACGLVSLMTCTGSAPELAIEPACATTNGPFMTPFPAPLFFWCAHYSHSNLLRTVLALLVFGQEIGRLIKVKKPLYLQVVKSKNRRYFCHTLRQKLPSRSVLRSTAISEGKSRESALSVTSGRPML